MAPIFDITGVYCPMGCGQTLHLMPGGTIRCLAHNCPQPGAVQQILSVPETDDIVVFGMDSFTVLHPLRERLGDLFSCQVHTACNRLDGPPGGKTGRYRARFGPEGNLELEEIDDYDSPPPAAGKDPSLSGTSGTPEP
jgi:Family of unknown function (DUF6085)